jgi:hypothetical protein
MSPSPKRPTVDQQEPTQGISPGQKQNLETIIRAAKNGDLCLMQCTDAKSGQKVDVLAAYYMDKGEYVMVPMAKLFEGNPYEELLPPGMENSPLASGDVALEIPDPLPSARLERRKRGRSSL